MLMPSLATALPQLDPPPPPLPPLPPEDGGGAAGVAVRKAAAPENELVVDESNALARQ
jgi:hypothetical protein